MDKEKLLNLFKETGAFLEGHFSLSSGMHSNAYLQCALILQYPDIAEEICRALAGLFKDEGVTCVAAPALGGVIVSYETARALGVKAIFTERKDGRMILRRGFSVAPGDRVLVVEDVITTGLSTQEIIEVIKGKGARVIGVGSIVNRSGRDIDFGVKSESLLKIDLPAFPPGSCPLCKEGIEIIKPGSR